MLIKKIYIEEVGGYDPSIFRFGEDWDFLIRLCSKGPFIYIDEPLFYYRVHRDSQQQTTPKLEHLSKFVNDTLKVIQKNANLLFEGNTTRFNQVQAWVFERAGAWYFVRESWEQGKSHLIRSSELFQDKKFRIKVATRIAYCKAIILLDELHSPNLAENCMNNDFLPKMAEHWPSYLGKLPRNRIMGIFFQTLAFQLDQKEKKMKSKLCLKSIINYPRLLFSPKTMLTILRGYFYNGK